jgi:hypothetical protein
MNSGVRILWFLLSGLVCGLTGSVYCLAMGDARFLCHGGRGSALGSRGLECGLLGTIGMRFSVLDGAVVA